MGRTTTVVYTFNIFYPQSGYRICAYAVMSHHVYMVLHMDVKQLMTWTDNEIMRSWHLFHKGTLLSQMFVRGDTLSQGQQLSLDGTIIEYRKRLHDISWLMRNLNEYIAREANKEDDSTDRFWKERFKSQAFLDEAALLACMVYVDLNPIRAKIANTPETSTHTSIQKCLESIKQPATHSLIPFVGNPRQDMPRGIAFLLKDYCELVDITGRAIIDNKAGHIEHRHKPILKRLGLSDEQWLTLTTKF